MYLQEDMKCFILNEFCSKDVVAVGINDIMINGKLRNLIVCSVYMDSTIEEVPLELISLITHCKNSNLNLILGTDSNALHWDLKEVSAV